MTRFFKYTLLLAAVALLASSCRQDDLVELPEVKDGYTSIEVALQAPDMTVVNTRAVDPDGAGVHRVTVFCFDVLGHLIEWVDASVNTGSQPSVAGTITKAEIPSHARILHFVANQDMSRFALASHKGKTEQQMMAELNGSSGMMIYWGRFEGDPSSNKSIKEQLQGQEIKLLCNQAKFTVNVESGAGFQVEGFAVVNTSAFGTVAPLHPEKGFNFSVEGADSDWASLDFITLPMQNAMLTPPIDVDDAAETYVFETENVSSNPVSVIIKGKNSASAESLYYRAVLIDGDGEQIMVRRNHHYKFNIQGALSYGQPTFDAALTAPATNNVWLSIADEVNEVRNGDYILTVEKTDVVLVYDDDIAKSDYKSGDKLVLNYSLERVNRVAITEADKPVVSWVENGVANELFEHSFIVNTGASAHISHSFITVNLKPLAAGQQMATSTLLVKKGLLQRKIKIVVMRRQKFTPAWVTTQMYGGDTNTAKQGFDGSNVTLLFTIPETCPDEMLPFEVYISVDHLDVRAESGDVLPVIRSSDPRYGEDVLSHPGAEEGNIKYGAVIGYKYVYTVTKKGDQRVYFKNILDQTNDDTDADHVHSEYVTLESPNFETLRKPYVFSDNGHQNILTLANLATYNAFGDSSSTEPIYYMLVPQKKHAPVEFQLVLKGENNANVDVVQNDEFFVFSENLLSQVIVDYNVAKTYFPSLSRWPQFPVKVIDIHESEWSTGGRVQAATPRVDSEYNYFNDRAAGNRHEMDIFFLTSKAKSAEVIRIASNQKGSKAAWPDKWASGIYQGNTYRSVIFELSNYRPYRFAAQLKYGANNYIGEYVDHDAAEGVVDVPEDIVWDYQPNQDVKVAFDITDFKAADGKSVDPFGLEFEVYIKAPMLEIDSDENHLPADKFYYDNAKGAFVYKVAATREAENAFWDGEPMIGLATLHAAAGRSKAGERKVLPFKTKAGQIVKDGQIEISSNHEQVVYDSKLFNVSSAPIEGTIKFGPNVGNLQNVPANAFVVFALVKDGSRIGSLSVGANGQYKLILRKEYEFDWNDTTGDDDKVEIHYVDGASNTYRAEYDNLAALWNNTNIQLIKVIE